MFGCEYGSISMPLLLSRWFLLIGFGEPTQGKYRQEKAEKKAIPS